MSLPDLEYDDARVVLTGAASGMGEQMALQLAAAGARLVLVDIDADRLAAVRERLRGSHVGATVTHVADLGDRDQLVAVAQTIASEVDDVDVLINNAGVALFGRFDEMTLDEFEWVMHINLRAPIYLTHALLPTLKGRPGSHIVNMSSLFGLIAPAGQTAYSTSKFGLRGFSSSLAVELAAHRVGVTTVHPGGIATRIASDGRRSAGIGDRDFAAQQKASRKLLKMPPEKAAAMILKAAQQRRERLVIGTDAKIPDLVARAVPSRMNGIVAKVESRLGRRR